MVSLLTRILEIIAPRTCAVCGNRLTLDEHSVCAYCLREIPYTNHHYNPKYNKLAKTFWHLLPIENAAALFYYYSHSKTANIIYDLKYHNHPEIGTDLGCFAAEWFSKSNFFDGMDAIIPIPLAKKRYRQRGYNQSMEIAKGIQQITHLPILDNVMFRTEVKDTQTHLQRFERQENVKNVFLLKNPESIAEKHILLVDDVITSGSTIISCGQELQNAADVKISVFSLGMASNIL